MIHRCTSPQQPGWLALRQALWPHCTVEDHVAEMAEFCASPARFAQFVAYDSAGNAVGFAEAAIRSDYVNGAASSPVAFLEGIYVLPTGRRQGVARSLVREVEIWAIGAGCSELASDALLENVHSHAMHRALGFEETERVVFFRKDIG